MRVLIASTFLSLATTFTTLARPIDLPGTLAGGVQVCSPRRCLTTARGEQAPVKILSYQDGMANVRVGNEIMVAYPSDVVLKFKGCTLTLRSYLAKRFCPGWKPSR
jgi:hypothetical protein